MISRMGTRILGCDPATYTLREAGNGSVVRVDDGVAVWSAWAGRPSLLFGERVRSRCGVLMVGSFLRMTGYGVVDRSLWEKEKGPHPVKECGPKNLIVPLPYAGIIQVRYEGRPRVWTSQRKRSPSLVKSMLTLNLYLRQ